MAAAEAAWWAVATRSSLSRRRPTALNTAAGPGIAAAAAARVAAASARLPLPTAAAHRAARARQGIFKVGLPNARAPSAEPPVKNGGPPPVRGWHKGRSKIC